MESISSASLRRFGPLAAAAAMSLAITASASAATIPTGPSGDSFYAPSSTKYRSGSTGDVIWKRTAQAATTLSNASQSITVVYKSKSLANKLIPVSGTVWIPKGTAPTGGWPIISWGHGTTGSADKCAPSRIADLTSGSYSSYVFPTLNRWLGKGYAVAMTDYEGLGTPGVHPWIIGPSEGRGMVDIVKAARKLNSKISSSWISAGHSQGGHAALFAASLAKTWGTGLTLKGVIPFAPASNMKSTVLFAASAITGPNQISGLGALLIRSITQADTTIKLSDLMPANVLALAPLLEQRCIGGDPGTLGASDAFGQFAPRNLVKGWVSYDWRGNSKWAKMSAALDGSKINSAVKISAPVKLLQGTQDGTVPEASTAKLFTQLKTLNGSSSATYETFTADHGGIVSEAGASAAADAFLLARFGR